MSLTNLSSSAFKSELQDLITTCRRTRLHVDRICSNLIHHAVIITPLGYAVVDLGLLNPSKVKDIILSKFISLILQFVSQRQRPIRGSALKLLLDYIRTFPCKTCLTAAGCYLSPAPGSKGTKMLVCCSPNADLPLKTELLDTSVNEVQNCYLSDVEQIITEAKLYADQFSQDGLGVQYLDLRPSDSVLVEAKRQGVLSESTYWSIVSLQEKESENFRSQSDIILDFQLENEEPANDVPSRVLYEGKTGYFMNRFLVKWNLNKKMSCNLFSTKDTDLSRVENWNSCSSRVIGHDLLVEVRHMVDADWLYLAKLAESQNERLVPFPSGVARKTGRISCSDYVKQSAERALLTLKSIPVAARRTLPVLVNSDGLLLSIPSIEFQHCPCLEASAVFKPMVPLGAGYTSFL